MFANEYHEGGCGTGHVLSSIRAGLLPDKPAPQQHSNFPQIKPWTRKEYRTVAASLSNAQRGETDGNATTVRTKGKPGCPKKKTSDQGANSKPTHFYLQNVDGTPVSEEEIAEKSRKARMLWRTLDEDGMVPPTFGQISQKAWEFFSLMILADEAHEFLLLCDDGEWKLWEWSTRSYPLWHCNRFNQALKDADEAGPQGK
jgi:hypothetical protein